MPKGFILGPLIAAVVAVVSLALIDLALYSLGMGLKSSLPPGDWGTYGDWAQGILPMFAIILSVGMWLSDKSDSDAAERKLSGASVYLRPRDGRKALVNNGAKQIYYADPVSGSLTCLAPGDVAVLGLDILAVEFSTVYGENWRAGLDKPSARII